MKKCIKKKLLVLITVSCSIVFFSCSNNQSGLITYGEEETLKNSIKEKGENTVWSKEIEGGILTENIKKKSSVLSNSLSPTVMNVISGQQEPVYPYFENFGSLDTRNLSVDVKKVINNFCSDVSANLYLVKDSYFNKNFYFSYVFFTRELEENWKENFHENFPVKMPTLEELKNQKKTEDLDKSEDKEKSEIKATFFSNWIFGQPFVSEEYLQVPIRFFAKKGSIDVILSLDNKSPYKFFNIEVKDWELK